MTDEMLVFLVVDVVVSERERESERESRSSSHVTWKSNLRPK